MDGSSTKTHVIGAWQWIADLHDVDAVLCSQGEDPGTMPYSILRLTEMSFHLLLIWCCNFILFSKLAFVVSDRIYYNNQRNHVCCYMFSFVVITGIGSPPRDTTKWTHTHRLLAKLGKTNPIWWHQVAWIACVYQMGGGGQGRRRKPTFWRVQQQLTHPETFVLLACFVQVCHFAPRANCQIYVCVWVCLLLLFFIKVH